MSSGPAVEAVSGGVVGAGVVVRAAIGTRVVEGTSSSVSSEAASVVSVSGVEVAPVDGADVVVGLVVGVEGRPVDFGDGLDVVTGSGGGPLFLALDGQVGELDDVQFRRSVGQVVLDFLG